MICVNLFLFCSCIFNSYAYNDRSTQQPDLTSDTRYYTNFIDDRLYWYRGNDLTVYNLSRCPLDVFENYKRLFPVPISVADVRGGYVHKDKNYFVVWEIIDSMLYLCDARIDAFRHDSNRKLEREEEQQYLPGDKKYRLIEELTGRKFQSLKNDNKHSLPLKPQGALPATWFSGEILMKKNSPEAYDTWFATPFLEVTFRNGRVVSAKEIWVREDSGQSVAPETEESFWRRK